MIRIAMILSVLSLSLCLGCSASTQRKIERDFTKAGEEEIAKTHFSVKRIPVSVDEFLVFRDEHAESAEGAAATFALALVVYADNNPLGMQCLTIAIHPEMLDDDEESGVYKGKRPRRADMSAFASRIAANPYIAYSYLSGTSPDSAYEIPEGELTIVTKDGTEYGDDVRCYVYSSGADSPRPIRLRENNEGIWKAVEWSSLTSGIKKPKDLSPDDL